MSIYSLLNLMSDKGIDVYRVVSVLGYCLLPMVGVGAVSVVITLEYVFPVFLNLFVYSYMRPVELSATCSLCSQSYGAHALHRVFS